MFNKTPRIVTLTFFLLFTILFFYGIIVAKSFLSALVLGMIFSYLLYPLVNFLELKARFPRVLANIVSILLLIGVLTLAIFIMYKNVGIITADMPSLLTKAHHNIDQLGLFAESAFGTGCSGNSPGRSILHPTDRLASTPFTNTGQWTGLYGQAVKGICAGFPSQILSHIKW